MNSRRLFAPFLGLAGAVSSLVVVVSVLLGHGNQLGMLFRYILIAGFVIGLVFPRSALIFWLVLCAYTDLLKRLMVVFGTVQHSDLYGVLGIPPVMLFGIALAVVTGALSGRYQLKATHWRLFGGSCALILIAMVLAAREKGYSLAATIPAIANFGAYTLLIFVVPVLFKGTDDLVKLAKVLLWAYVPVACYGVFQQINGFQDFEIAYLKTGLSLEIKQLYANEVRPFSTLNSPTALSVICAVLCAVSAVLACTPRREGRGPILRPTMATLFAALYLAGLIASTSRSALILAILAPLGFFCFRSGRGTRWLYAGLAISFVVLVLTASFMLSEIDVVQSRISSVTGDNQLAHQLSRVGTFSDRLRGYAGLATNPEVYTLFGHGGGRRYTGDALYSHDMISNILISHGLVPLLGLTVIGAMVLVQMHRRVLGIDDRHHRLLAAGFLSLAFSFFPLSTFSGSVIAIFPVNTLLWLCFAFLMIVYESDSRQRADEKPQKLPADAEPCVEPPPRVIHRFRRSGYGSPDGS